METTTEQFVEALFKADAGALSAALARDADVNLALNMGQLVDHPLAYYLVVCEHYFRGEEPIKSYTTKDRAKIIECAEVLLSHNPNLQRPTAYDGPCHLDFILKEADQKNNDPVWYDLAARAVINTLAQNIVAEVPVYQIDLTKVFASTPNDVERTRRMDSIAKVHARVVERLQSAPANLDEEILAEHKEKVSFWRQPFPRPRLMTFPKPKGPKFSDMLLAKILDETAEMNAPEHLRFKEYTPEEHERTKDNFLQTTKVLDAALLYTQKMDQSSERLYTGKYNSNPNIVMTLSNNARKNMRKN